MANVLTFGETMALLTAESPGALKDAPLFKRSVCGAEMNVSVGLTRLGHCVSYISRVGQDPFGEHILDFMEAQKISARFIGADAQWRTGMQLKEKTMDGRDPLVINFRKGSAFSHITIEELPPVDWQQIDHLHVTGITAGLSMDARTTMLHLMDTAREHGAPISFDPNLRPTLWASQEEMTRVINEVAAHADIVLPGHGEGKILTGEKEPEAIADTYLARGAKTVIVKLGTDGAFTKNNDGSMFHTRAFPVTHIVDTVGAGDGFAVGVLSGILEGLSLQEAVRRGAAIGALVVMTAGDNEGLPTKDQLRAFMQRNQ